jgi:hypothetical protein
MLKRELILTEPMAKKDLIEHLEAIVDDRGLLDMLIALECMCSEKADHLRVNWQDKSTAKEWDRMAKLIRGVADKCEL